MFSIFIKPNLYKNFIEKLKARNLSEQETLKRIEKYKDSEMFIEQFKDQFYMIFTNNYTDKAIEDFLTLFDNLFEVESSTNIDQNL